MRKRKSNKQLAVAGMMLLVTVTVISVFVVRPWGSKPAAHIIAHNVSHGQAGQLSAAEAGGEQRRLGG